MNAVLQALAGFLFDPLRSRTSLQAEILALRHQLAVYERGRTRPRLRPADRILWAWLSRVWSRWRDALFIVQPRTVVAWQKRRFRDHWRKRSQPGRPTVSRKVRYIVRRMSEANPLWGAPRIQAELAKIGIEIAKSTVEKYMVRRSKPPSPTWKAFLKNHVRDLVSIDFFVVPTANFRVLFVFLVLATDRRRVLHFNVTEHPTTEWTAQQIVEAFPWDGAPDYLLRDRDRTYGATFRRRVHGLGIKEVLTAARSPWQNPYVERVIGSIRRECLDHVVVLSERHLRRLLSDYFDYYHRWRTHYALEMDTPDGRSTQEPELGEVVEFPEVRGLHHHYERRAA